MKTILGTSKSLALGTHFSSAGILLATAGLDWNSLDVLRKQSLGIVSTLVGGVVDKLPGNATWSFTPVENATGFHAPTTMTKKAVGRWPQLQLNPSQARQWAAFQSISLPPQSQFVFDGVSKPSLVLSLSDAETRDFTSSLDTSFPSATKLGLVAAPTPFVNGRPVTLFHNDEIHSSGSVGLCFTSAQEWKQTFETSGLKTIGQPLKISKCQGNIILELSDANATKTLISKVDSAGISTSNEFFVRVLEKNGSSIYKIIGGDLAKGTLAIDTNVDLKVGSDLEILFLDVNHVPEESRGSSDVCFGTIPEAFVDVPSTQDLDSMCGLRAWSTNGFYFSQPNVTIQFSNIPWASASITH